MASAPRVPVTVVILCNYGAFRSEDKGKTWEHLPEQFREDITDGDIIYVGPRIVDHPDIGLCAFGNTVGYGKSDKFPNPVDGPVETTRSAVSSNQGDALREGPNASERDPGSPGNVSSMLRGSA